MKLVLVRHADAGDRLKWRRAGRPDEDRPLSKKGRNQAKVLARRMRFLFKNADLVLTSPLVRALETAEILQEKSARARPKRLRLVEVDELKPLTAPEVTLEKVKTFKAQKILVMVGHEPHLGRFLSFILTGRGHESFDISKGAIALVEFEGEIEKGRGRLTCFLQPTHLKKI